MEDRDIYSGDSLSVRVREYVPSPHPVPHGQDVSGVDFDGYPQIVKEGGSQPTYEVKKKKDSHSRDPLREVTPAAAGHSANGK